MARELSLLVHFHVDVIEVLFLVYLKFRILEVLTRGDRACNLIILYGSMLFACLLTSLAWFTSS